MASSVDICNMALSLLGDSAEVTSINPPEGVQAGHCAKWYPIALRTVLERHGWSFATLRVRPTEMSNVDARLYGKDNAFAIPSNCLKILNLQSYEDLSENSPERFYAYEMAIVDKNARRALFTDIKDPVLTYIVNVETPELFPGYFIDCLVPLLATYLYGPVKRADTTSQAGQNLLKLYESALSRAKNLDAESSMHRREKRIPNVIKAREV